MIGQQGSQLLFKPELVKSCFLVRSHDRPDQGVEGRIPTVQLVKEQKRRQLFFNARVQDPVCRSYQGIKNRSAEKFPEMDVKGFGAAGIFFDPEGIQLGAIADKIAVIVDEGSLPVHAAKAISPYI